MNLRPLKIPKNGHFQGFFASWGAIHKLSILPHFEHKFGGFFGENLGAGFIHNFLKDLVFLRLKTWYTYFTEINEEEYLMPEISLFYGIRVTMYYDDHNPPHFHAEYNGNKALIEIDKARVIKGALPSRQLKLILAWCVLHQDELMQNWELSKDGKPLNRINPLV